MNVLIYGAGAVGLGIASCLLASGVSVSIVARENTAQSLVRAGLRRLGIFGSVDHPAETFAVSDSLDSFLAVRYDCVLVCTKSYDTKSAGRDLARLLNPGTGTPCFVLLQNGWGNREAISRYLPSEEVCNARVITGFTRPEPSVVEITVHADDIHMGHFDGVSNPVLDEVCRAIARGGVPCSQTDGIVGDLWAKMLYNCSLNSLGAIFEASYGELADNAYSRELLDRIIDECFVVMSAAGYSTHWATAEAYKKVFYGALVPATRDHYPSTLQDLRAGKRTEIDALNGSVIKIAESQSADAPYNRMAYNMVKHKESAATRHK